MALGMTLLCVVLLSILAWRSVHRLDPYQPLDSAVEPLDVDVVALDSKWLFIYPAQGVAAVNELVFPGARPLRLNMTSNTAMNSPLASASAGQIYAMAGMQTRINVIANLPGRFAGRNSQYSGSGFSDQQFDAIALSQQEFDAWLAKARRSSATLDRDAFQRLTVPSVERRVMLYSSVEPRLFDDIEDKSHASLVAAEHVDQ